MERSKIRQGPGRGVLDFILGIVGSKGDFCKGMVYTKYHMESTQPEIEATSPEAPGQGSLPSGRARLCFAGASAKLKGALIIH